MAEQNNFSNNAHITSFLDYYTGLSSPHYAILLTGKWGIGKTFFITKYMEKDLSLQKGKADDNKEGTESNPPIIKISLNGIQTKDEINNMLIREFHPFFKKKGVNIMKKIGASVGNRFNVNLSYFRISDFYNVYNEKTIYVFDDLERCCMPIEVSLGHINSFVENNNCRVIIIGNEEEIKRGNDEQSYKAIKEKIIGKTLKMMPETEEAFNYFLKQLRTDSTRTFLKSQRAWIKQIYKTSELDNLRILQQSLNDFERLYEYLADKHKQNEVFMKDLVTIFFILSFEIKAGLFSCSFLEELKNSGSLEVLDNLCPRNDGNQKNGQKKYLEKYDGYFIDIIRYKNIFSNDMLTHILEEGFFPEDAIKQELNNLPSYFPSNEPWINLWFWPEQKNEELDSMLEQFEQKFEQKQYLDIGTILHAFGLKLFFARNDLINKTISEIDLECRDYIDHIINELSEENLDFELPFQSSSHGLCFYESNSKEWSELNKYLKEKLHTSISNKFEKTLKDKILANEQPTVEQIKILNNPIFSKICVLALLDVNEFCKYLIDNSYIKCLSVFNIVKNRYYLEKTDTKKKEIEYCKIIKDNLVSIKKNSTRWKRMKIEKYINDIGDLVGDLVGDLEKGGVKFFL